MLRKKAYVALILLTVSVSVTGCGFVQKLRARDALNKGVKAFTEQKFTEAAEFFKESLELDSEFSVARVYLAATYTSQFVPGSPDPSNKEMANRAIQIFEQVIEAEKPDTNVDAMVSIASLYYQLQDYDRSKDWCRQIEQVDPQNAEALYRIAVIDFDQSLRATGLQGENVEFLTDEEKQQNLGLIDEGLEALGTALEIRPEYFDALDYQNLLWREKAKFQEEEEVKNELIRQADMVAQKALILRLKAQEEEAKKPKKIQTQ